MTQFLPQQATLRGPKPELALFDDAHGFLHNVRTEVEIFREQIARTDEHRRAEIEELRKTLEQQRFERRDALNKLRFEFEEFVHRKIDKVLEDVEEMKRAERCDDSQQQAHIDSLIQQTDGLKERLFMVQNSWGKLVANCLTPAGSAIAASRVEAQRLAAEQQRLREEEVAATMGRRTSDTAPETIADAGKEARQEVKQVSQQGMARRPSLQAPSAAMVAMSGPRIGRLHTTTDVSPVTPSRYNDDDSP